MAVTKYITVDGMILGEVTNGVMRNYGTDALGSVVATYTGGALENTYRYKPYGGLLAKTGTATDPKFLWNGDSGYRASNLSEVGLYVRFRHYSFTAATWTAVDGLWPLQSPYGYVSNRPVSGNDPTGLAGSSQRVCGCCPLYVDFTWQKCTSYPLYNILNGYAFCPYAANGAVGFGHVLYVYLVFAYINAPPPLNAGACNVTWNEVDFYLKNGVYTQVPTIPWQNSDSYFSYYAPCIEPWNTVTKCVGSDTCVVMDNPMVGPPSFTVKKSYPYARALSISVTLQSSNPAVCPSVTKEWDQYIEWTWPDSYYPSTWNP